MSPIVWDIPEPISALNARGMAVDERRLADLDVPLDLAVVGETAS